jgi:hypothetical protein
LVTGATRINRQANGTYSFNGRTGVKFHPSSDEKIRRGAIEGSTSTDNDKNEPGWNHNNTSNKYRRFNRTRSQSGSTFSNIDGHIIGLTWDASAIAIEDRLKVSWGMEHNDASANTGITLFDFDNDNAADLCYRDEVSLRVISPARGHNDYVVLSEDTTTTNTSVMFKYTTRQGTGTGTEYPVIADVNMDGSADIVITNSNSTSASRGWIDVFEYQGHKWTPCPPVWNQGMYDPTQIREDLKINARPISMLTSRVENNEIIYPYNGSWIQQPIVIEGDDYRPIVRKPDAVLKDMKVTVNSPTSTTVELVIYNGGTATIAASAPIYFYDGGGRAGSPPFNQPADRSGTAGRRGHFPWRDCDAPVFHLRQFREQTDMGNHPCRQYR